MIHGMRLPVNIRHKIPKLLIRNIYYYHSFRFVPQHFVSQIDIIVTYSLH